ncbi:contact-dependent growth inhibition system immunity protein [Streptomyces sp. NPDC046887]|uniref:contact-dependent growth inhibition system immunity protein n=1 Tax=Streptomyces sp. NPDC046887 TaxID=3155472 RepID=UPI0033ECA65C
MTRSDVRSFSIEALEGTAWTEPTSPESGLVSAIHRLRKVPIGELTAWDMTRLIGQNEGLEWLVPAALQILSDGIPEQVKGGWYEDDLLFALLTRSEDFWDENPSWEAGLKTIISQLADLTPAIQGTIRSFENRKGRP